MGKNEKNEIERWKDVVGYEGLYRVSSFGNVHRLKGAEIDGRRCNGGPIKNFGTRYAMVNLWRNHIQRRHYIHRLVLEAFVGSWPKGMETRHFPDRDKQNCRLNNLSWATHQINMLDQIAHKTHKVNWPNVVAKRAREL